MASGPEFLPGIGDYNEFRHRLKDEEDTKRASKRPEMEVEIGPDEADEEIDEDLEDE
jgi:hypothetical protein